MLKGTTVVVVVVATVEGRQRMHSFSSSLWDDDGGSRTLVEHGTKTPDDGVAVHCTLRLTERFMADCVALRVGVGAGVTVPVSVVEGAVLLDSVLVPILCELVPLWERVADLVRDCVRVHVPVIGGGGVTVDDSEIVFSLRVQLTLRETGTVPVGCGVHVLLLEREPLELRLIENVRLPLAVGGGVSVSLAVLERLSDAVALGEWLALAVGVLENVSVAGRGVTVTVRDGDCEELALLVCDPVAVTVGSRVGSRCRYPR